MNWNDIVADATLKSYEGLDDQGKDAVSFLLIRPPAQEGLRRWWQLLER